MGAGSYIVTAEYENATRRSHILIGNYTSIAHEIHFNIGLNHDYKKITTFTFEWPDVFKQFQALYPDVQPYQNPETVWQNNHYQIVIGNDVWIGAGATIMGGVKIGSGAVIGAHAVVAKNIPPYAIAVGNPARVIKYRFDEVTIKKLMAVKWWNWELEKVYKNYQLMNHVDEFLEKYYSPELEKISEDDIPADVPLEQYKAEGMKIFAFIADFNEEISLWRRVIKGFYQSTLKDAVLLFGISLPFKKEQIEELEKKIILANSSVKDKIVHVIPLQDSRIFPPYILKNSTHFIATREMRSLECIDWLWDTDVKIVSALDEGIFEGEPAIVWD